jgi:nucleotide-binding universal stress UspA family protein
VRRLLVPIDDQAVSGETLRVIADAARSAAYTIRLLYVPPVRPDGDSARTLRHQGEEKRRLQAEGLHYLDTLAESLGDVPIERMVRFGDVNMAILDEAAAWAADVVALSAGDRMWLSRAVRTGRAVEAFGTNGIPAILYTPRRRARNVSRRNRVSTRPRGWRRLIPKR